MSHRPEPTSLREESYSRLRQLAESQYRLYPDESHAAAEMTLARLSRHPSMLAHQSAADPPAMLLYGQLLSASCEEILERRRREQEFLECSLTVELYERHHGRLASIVEAKLHLDCDLANDAASLCIKKFVRAAQLRATEGDPTWIEDPDQYNPFLYSTCLRQAAEEVRRRWLPADSERVALDATWRDSAPTAEQDLVNRDALLEAHRKAIQLAPKIPQFIQNLENTAGKLGIRFRELRVLARGMGADSIILQVDFMRRYLFENRAVGSDAARRDITRLLGWHSEKSGNARYVALRRLRVRMQETWQSVSERVFLSAKGLSI